MRQRRGRWCFGNLNSVAGRLHAHYLFLACTPFLYPVGSGQEYHVDAVQKRSFCGPFYAENELFQDRLGTSIGNVETKRRFCRCTITSASTSVRNRQLYPLLIQKRSFYQDKLRTNISKTQKRPPFAKGSGSMACGWR